MAEDEWIATVDESSLKEGEIGLASLKGISVMLIKKAERVFVLRNRCPHLSCTLAGGRLDDYTLHCPCHDWRYDIRTGKCLDAAEIVIPAFESRTQDGKVYVRSEGGRS